MNFYSGTNALVNMEFKAILTNLANFFFSFSKNEVSCFR